MTTTCFQPTTVWLALGLFAGLLSSLPCAAQYKVVAPDGGVTYTDRPTSNAANKVTELRRGQVLTIDDSNANWPLELRQAASRFPVVLFTTAACPSCDQGRAQLTQRGVPYQEQVISTQDEAQDMERKLGWRTVPTLTVGAQGLRGWSSTEWASYLDVAGYPRESRLPKSWRPAATRAGEAASSAASSTESAIPAPIRSVESTGVARPESASPTLQTRGKIKF